MFINVYIVVVVVDSLSACDPGVRAHRGRAPTRPMIATIDENAGAVAAVTAVAAAAPIQTARRADRRR